jgi:two-component system nitrate/nitrite response regulator NarL
MAAQGLVVGAIPPTAQGGLAAVAALRPEAVLLDLGFPDGVEGPGAGRAQGLDAARAMRQQHPDTAILVLSNLADPETWSAATKIGVAGFLRKDKCVSELADALDVIARGGVVLDAGLHRRVSQRLPRRRRSHIPHSLTPREREVLRRIVAGQSSGQMAGEMNITVSTLRTYVKNVLTKLGAHSRLHAAAMATREDLLGELSA